MPTVNQDIEVNAPVEQVYQLWTQYERFPDWMEHVQEVRRIGPDRTHWRAKIAGQEMEWDATTLTESNRRVAWRAMGEAGQSGEVRFEPAGTGKTRINVQFDYTLGSKMKETAASGLGLDESAVKDDLQNFKQIVEGNR